MLRTVLSIVALALLPSFAWADERGDLLDELDVPAGRLVELAEATPANLFSFRPVDRVRTVSEVYMHVATNNFYAARDLGLPLPEDLPSDLELEVTSKTEVLDYLARSFDRFEMAVKQVDPGAEIHLWGKDRSTRSVLLHFIGHAHEHLGQSVAYARAAGVVPPWSR